MNLVVAIETAERVTKVELYPEVVSNTVHGFLSLVKKGFYDDTIFHRVIPGFVIQGGDPEGIGTGGPDYHIRSEFAKNGSKNDLKHTKGVISMARVSHPDSANSQFLPMTGDVSYLDSNYTAFGKIIEDLEEADHVVGAPRDAKDRPRENQMMEKVTVETFSVKYKEPETLPL